MKKLLFLCVLISIVCFAQYVRVPFTKVSGGSTPTVVQPCVGTGGFGSLTCVFGGNDTTGNAILLTGWTNGPSPGVPTMTGATFSQVTGSCGGGTTSFQQYFFYATGITGGQTTVTWSVPGWSIELHGIEVHNLLSGPDGSLSCAAGSTAGSPISSGTSGAPSGNDIALAGARQDTTGTTFTVNSPYTQLGNPGDNFVSSYNTVSSATTAQYAYTGSNGNPYESGVMLFR